MQSISIFYFCNLEYLRKIGINNILLDQRFVGKHCVKSHVIVDRAAFGRDRPSSAGVGYHVFGRPHDRAVRCARRCVVARDNEADTRDPWCV